MKATHRVSNDFKKERESQFKRFRRLTWVWTSLVLFISLVGSAFALKSETLRSLERKISWPIQFQFRDQLERNPRVDDRIHVIMFDDATVQKFNKANLSMAQWASLLSYLDRYNPASIYIDKIFGLVDGDQSLPVALPEFRQIKAHVSVGAFTTATKIPGRSPLDLSSKKFKAERLFGSSRNDASGISLQTMLNNSKFKDRSSSFVYGPIPELRDLFHQGHIDWLGENEIYPIYQFGERRLLATLAMSGRINLSLDNGVLAAGGKHVPLRSDGSVLVNWLRPEVIYKQASTVAQVFEMMKSDKILNTIPKDSHIIILPLAFTGNADFKTSPYGLALGGMMHVSVLNSVLTQSWLYEFKDSLLAVFILLLAMCCLQFVPGIKAWLILLVVLIAVPALSLYAFVYHSTDIPWFMGSSIIAFSGVFTLSIRNLWESRRDRLLTSLEREFELLEKEEKRLAKEMADASRIALALRPEDPPDWPTFWISSFCKSFNEASGDWFFFERSPSGRYGHFVLCDITGHGVQAALVVSSCKTIVTSLRMAGNETFESEKFVENYALQLNKVLFEHGQGTHSTTLVGITFDFENNSMHYTNCGHPFPIWHSCSDSKKSVGLLGSAGDPLGFSEELQVVSSSRNINIGDVVIIHSDGVPLSRSRRILKRYFDEIDSGIMISAKRLHNACMREFVQNGHEPIQDDASMVVFRRQS